MAWEVPNSQGRVVPPECFSSTNLYSNGQRIGTWWAISKRYVPNEIITVEDLNAAVAADTISSWSNRGGAGGVSNGKVYTAADWKADVTEDQPKAHGHCSDSYEPTRLEFTKQFDDFRGISTVKTRDLSVDGAKRFDDFLAISAAKSQDLAHNGNGRCEAVPYTPDAESEPDTPLVPTDVQVPDNFRVEEYLCVRMYFDRYGEFEDDTELWSTPAGAQGRIRQILFTRDDVISCEAVTVWKREKA